MWHCYKKGRSPHHQRLKQNVAHFILPTYTQALVTCEAICAHFEGEHHKQLEERLEEPFVCERLFTFVKPVLYGEGYRVLHELTAGIDSSPPAENLLASPASLDTELEKAQHCLVSNGEVVEQVWSLLPNGFSRGASNRAKLLLQEPCWSRDELVFKLLKYAGLFNDLNA